MSQIELPDWIVYLIGRQTIENEALRRTLNEHAAASNSNANGNDPSTATAATKPGVP